MTQIEQALVKHALAQSRIVRELLASHYRAAETETTGGRLMKRSAEADALLSLETGAEP
jgi:hypothetical protein